MKEMSKDAYMRRMSVRRAILVGCHCNVSKDKDIDVLAAGTSVKLARAQGLTWLPDFVGPIRASATTSFISRYPIYRRCGHMRTPRDSLKLGKLGVFG